MASVFKRRELRPIPEGATITTYRGKRCATWTDAKGKTRRAPLGKGGGKIVKEAPFYTVEYFDESGKRRKSKTRCSDKDAALQIAAELEKQVSLRRSGIVDGTMERFAQHGRRPISEHIADFVADLRARGNTPKHVEMTAARVALLVQRCKAVSIADLRPSSIQRAINGVRQAGRGLATCNSYLRAIKAFSRWLCRDKRAPDDALETLVAFNTDADRRHERRELTPAEVTYLRSIVQRRTSAAHALPGPDRALLYRLALGTGFRAGELRSLIPTSIDLQAEPPTVTVSAAHSKRRRQDVQPIRADLAAELQKWLDGRPEGERLFKRMPRYTARMLKKDLDAARAQWIADVPEGPQREQRERSDFLCYRDAAGRVADFHATRHTFISGIVATGASVKTAQELARHSTPTLTIGRYSHARLHDLTGALEALPSTTPSPLPEQRPLATGTDGGAMGGLDRA